MQHSENGDATGCLQACPLPSCCYGYCAIIVIIVIIIIVIIITITITCMNVIMMSFCLTVLFRATETMLAETMLADLRVRTGTGMLVHVHGLHHLAITPGVSDFRA